ncbi:MAG: sigma-70 family RNA polymerase sigma factor [Clostridia bacterium]|nr:sigma-70 family RNA polymerase sigma factor [Clostridia bacterium]
MEDDRIVQLYLERNESAIAETEAKYGKYCYAIAYNILHSHLDSEECLDDTWLGAWRSIPPKRPSRLQYFLARITRNIAIDRYRRDSAEKRNAIVDSAIDEYWECIPSPGAEIDDELALKSAINGFLASLEKRNRIIFMRRYWYSMSIEAIAKGMNLSVSNVSVILHRTRERFKAYLTKEGICL